MTKERNSNFELLRIISMFFIVLGHTILHGNINYNIQNESIRVIFDILSMIVIVHVNSYILVTGYFQSTSSFKQSKLWQIIAQCLFYRIVIVGIMYFFNIKDFSNMEIARAIFPLNIREYWFIGNYLILYCVSPFINKLIEVLNKKEYQKLLITLTVIFSLIPYITGNSAVVNDGYTLYNFVYLYLIGAYIRIYPIEKSYFFKRYSKQLLKIIYLSMFMICVLANYCIFKTSSLLINDNTIFKPLAVWFNTMTYAYSNPIIIIQTIFYFAYFGIHNIKSSFINKWSALTLGVYLIHDNSHVRYLLYKWLKIDAGPIKSYTFILYTLLIAIGIFLVCSIIELIRQLFFKIARKTCIYKNIRKRYYEIIENIKIKPETIDIQESTQID